VKHVVDLWFERVAHRVPASKVLPVSHVLVVVTDLLTDLEVVDIDALDYLETELRRLHGEAGDIRFIPVGRAPPKAGDRV
jgi:hypothetical protein